MKIVIITIDGIEKEEEPMMIMRIFILALSSTEPERPKGVKDEVKRPEGPPTRKRAPEGPNTSSSLIIFVFLSFLSSDSLFLWIIFVI